MTRSGVSLWAKTRAIADGFAQPAARPLWTVVRTLWRRRSDRRRHGVRLREHRRQRQDQCFREEHQARRSHLFPLMLAASIGPDALQVHNLVTWQSRLDEKHGKVTNPHLLVLDGDSRK